MKTPQINIDEREEIAAIMTATPRDSKAVKKLVFNFHDGYQGIGPLEMLGINRTSFDLFQFMLEHVCTRAGTESVIKDVSTGKSAQEFTSRDGKVVRAELAEVFVQAFALGVYMCEVGRAKFLTCDVAEIRAEIAKRKTVIKL